jgi:hypothetical protein
MAGFAQADGGVITPVIREPPDPRALSLDIVALPSVFIFCKSASRRLSRDVNSLEFSFRVMATPHVSGSCQRREASSSSGSGGTVQLVFARVRAGGEVRLEDVAESTEASLWVLVVPAVLALAVADDVFRVTDILPSSAL